MTQIALDGVVGLDVTAREIRQALDTADGDVELIVNSPGGMVTDGIAIFNAIRDYKRKKKGTVTARVVGMAASMATYIPMAADTVEIEDNAVWMIHNPWGLAIGDHNDMMREAEILDGMARILSRAYVAKTGAEEADIREMMDRETYLYGEAVATAGFADRVTPAGDGPDDDAGAKALAQQRVREAISRTRQQAEIDRDEHQRVAAMIRAELPPGECRDYGIISPAGSTKNTAKTPVVDGSNDKESRPMAGNGEVPMEKVQDNPATENARAYEDGVQDGIKKERQRVNELRSYIEADPENALVAEVINAAISDGSTASQINARLQVAIRDGGKLNGENPPAVGAEQAQGEKPATDEEIALAKALGISVDALRAQGGN